MGAEALAQRRVQQVRRGVVALGRAARARGRRARTRARRRAARPLSGSSTSAWSSPRRTTSTTARRAAAVLALDHAAVGDLAAAGRRRTGDSTSLASTRPFSASTRADRRRLLGRLVAGELGRRRPRRRRTSRTARARPRPPSRPRGARARARAAPPSAPRSPASSTPRPCSAASSSVSSNGKPNVSCSWNASSAPMPSVRRPRARVDHARRASAGPARACGRTLSSSRRSHMSIVSACSSSSG